uniref:Uncharacterized protein n=1 Tax=Arabidopsis thaliana TaxID=3702 RepID=Q0WSM8_ARATH|nr:hypothetical protein [Arabidopsis thaliana]
MIRLPGPNQLASFAKACNCSTLSTPSSTKRTLRVPSLDRIRFAPFWMLIKATRFVLRISQRSCCCIHFRSTFLQIWPTSSMKE